MHTNSKFVAEDDLSDFLLHCRYAFRNRLRPSRSYGIPTVGWGMCASRLLDNHDHRSSLNDYAQEAHTKRGSPAGSASQASSDSTYPDLTIQDYFLIDSVDTILRRKNLSNRQVEDGLVDGADDGGIDAVYLFVNGQPITDSADSFNHDNSEINLEIFQAKHESGFKEIPLQLLLDHLPILLSLGTSALSEAEFNSRVIERFELFRNTYLAASFPKLKINIRYATKAHEGPNEKVRLKAGRLQARLTGMFSNAAANVDFLGAKNLNNLARQRRSATYALRVSEGPITSEKADSPASLACATTSNS
jgi:hypothetical protein